MGQFASRAFDGDPYIDIMRALPDKELVWWVQKVIWLAEGATILEHFGRSYPLLFLHKCQHCNGAGTVTCTHCNGYKVKRVHAHALQLPQQTASARLLALSDLQNCDHCGSFGPWDNESEWQDEWNKWESKLAYYDRSRGALMDDWYEDVIHDGRLDEDTQPEEETLPPASDQSKDANISREVSKDKKRLKALMARFKGHPYENADILPGGILDPARSVAQNIEALGYNMFELPPEMHPETFPELLLEGPGGTLDLFDKQIQAEYMIMSNLDAAMRDYPKPAMFKPTAGTVTCPSCDGQAWQFSWIPSMARLLRAEQPFWARTFARMQPYTLGYSTDEGHPAYSPWVASTQDADRLLSHEKGLPSTAGYIHTEGQWGRPPRRIGEVPAQPPLLTAAQLQAMERELQPGPLPCLDADVVNALGARRHDGSVDYGRLVSVVGPSLSTAPKWFTDHGTNPMPLKDEAEGAALELVTRPGGKGEVSSRYGPWDPLSRNMEEALNSDDLEQMVNSKRGPLLGNAVARARLSAADLANPARAAARRLRDVKQLAKGETPEEQALLLQWAKRQPSLNQQ